MGNFRGISADPIRNFKFQVRFAATNGGQARSGFSSVKGLKETTEVVDYREGTEPGRPRKLFGQTTFDNVTLERGLTTNNEWLLWRRLITNVGNRSSTNGFASEGDASGSAGGTQGNLVRREVSVDLGDFHAEAGPDGAWTWTLMESWPTTLEIDEFSGDGNAVVIERVELVHEGLIVGNT
jgi:phage tail-like protein